MKKMLNNYNNLNSEENGDQKISLKENIKIDELKNYKEKDEWAVLSRKNHLDFLNDKLSKLQQQAEKKKEITQILANQIVEKNSKKKDVNNNDERYYELRNKEYENWKNSEVKIKEKKEKNIRNFIVERDNVYQSKFIFYSHLYIF